MTDDEQVPGNPGSGNGDGDRGEGDKLKGPAENVSLQNSIPGASEIASRQSYQKLSAIFSATRHDINNQLTILNGYLSLLDTPAPAMKTSEIIRILKGATGRIEQILRFSREYQNIGETPPEWQPLGGTIRQANKAVDTGTVRIITDPSCEDIELYADPQLARAFYHLIDNSLRHGGEKVSEIRIRYTADDTNLAVIFEDNGIGINNKVRPVLFEQARGKNTGYGLFLVREILAVTGIAITEKGSAGKGARFEIIVPCGSFRTGSGK